MKKILPYIVGLVIVAGLISLFMFMSGRNEQQSTETATTTQPRTTESTENNESTESEPDVEFKAEEVAMHSGADDCWTIIDGIVYDITPYVPRHPGGDEILRACGADGTSLFTQRTTDEGEQVGSGTAHSRSAVSQLASFKIGILAQ